MIKIALISDIHFGKLSREKEFSVPGEGISEEVVASISLREEFIKKIKEQKVEYIFIAGDLTTSGKPAEFFHFENQILSIADECCIKKENIILTLGNHDIDWSITSLGEEENYNDSKANELTKNIYIQTASYTSLCGMKKLSRDLFSETGTEPFSGVVEKDEFVVFILNSGSHSVRTESYGRLTKEQLEWFNKSLNKYKDDRRWKIVLLHHHPMKYSYPTHIRDISELSEGSELIDAASNGGVNLILHGHRHHPIAKTTIESNWKNPITYICAGSLSVNHSHRNNGEIPNVFHIIELEDKPGVLSLFNYRFSSDVGWTEVEYSSVTPLDYRMKLGKIFTEKEVEEEILKLPKGEPIYYDGLSETLKHQSLSKINSFLEKKYHEVVGKFPNTIMIMEEEQ